MSLKEGCRVCVCVYARGVHVASSSVCSAPPPFRYTLVEAIAKVEPAVLLLTLPMVAEHLNPDHDVKEREEAVKLFGNIFASEGRLLIPQDASIWRQFVARHDDEVTKIRILVVDYIPALFEHSDVDSVDADLTNVLLLRMCDAAEGVRIRSVEVGPAVLFLPFCGTNQAQPNRELIFVFLAPFMKVVAKLLRSHPQVRKNEALIGGVLDRLVDKKEAVSSTSFELLGQYVLPWFNCCAQDKGRAVCTTQTAHECRVFL